MTAEELSPNGGLPPEAANWSIADVDRWMLAHPLDAEATIQAFQRMARVPDGRQDIGIAAIPTTAHLDVRRYSFGLPRITGRARPIRAGKLVIVGAKEGAGKTAWAETVALANAVEHRVLFATLEMTPEEIRDRMLVKLMRTPLDAMHSERADETLAYLEAYDELTRRRDLKIWRPKRDRDRSIEAVTARALDEQAALLIIDHSRELTGWHAGKDAEQIMDYLGRFVRESSVTVFLLSQLRRRPSGQGGTCRPVTEDFQDTSRVEQKADHCILIWRPFLGQGRDRIVEIILGKNRGGPCFRGHAHWDGPTMSYHDVTDEEEAAAECCRRDKR